MSKAGYLGNKRTVTDDPKMQNFLKSSEKMVKLIKGTLGGSDLPKYMYPNPGQWKWHEHTSEAGQEYTDMYIDLEDPVPTTRQHSLGNIRVYSIYDDMCGVWKRGIRTKHGRFVKVSEVLRDMLPGVLFVFACRSTLRDSIVSEKFNKPSIEEDRGFMHPSRRQNYPRKYINSTIETARAQNRQGAKKRLLKPRSPTSPSPKTTIPPPKTTGRTIEGILKLVGATVRLPQTVTRRPSPSIRRTVKPRTTSKTLASILRGTVKPRTTSKTLASILRGTVKPRTVRRTAKPRTVRRRTLSPRTLRRRTILDTLRGLTVPMQIN